VTQRGDAKVLDFGLAKLLRRSSSESATTASTMEPQGVGGTLPYMSPEQLRGQEVDARTDIYSLGAVLYEMCTGRRAFSEEWKPRLMDQILHHPPVPAAQWNPHVLPKLHEIILKCLDKDPEKRYQSAKELAVDLRRLALAGTAPVSRQPLQKLRRPAWGLTAIIVIAVLSVTYFAWRGFRPRIHASSPKIMLLVLPFQNLAGDTEKDYFSDGLTEEMIAQLGGMHPGRMGVIARTSAMRYKHTDKGIGQIGRELGVDFVLEGSVRHMGDRVRITAQLVQVNDQTHLWAESYERDLAGTFSVQAEVAERIARSLQLELLPSQQSKSSAKGTRNPAAYEAYLKGRHEWFKSTEEGRRKAKEYFEEAISLDSNYAPSYAGLADYYWSTTEVPAQTAIPRAREYALKAIALDDASAEAYTTLADIRFFGDWDWSGAEKEFLKALELKPNNAEAYRAYSVFLMAAGRSEEALTKLRKALELDPQSPLINGVAGMAYYFAGEYDQAIQQCHKTLQLDPSRASPHSCLADSYRAKGMYEQAIAEARQAVDLSQGDASRVVRLIWAYAAAGRKNDAGKLLSELRLRAGRTYVSPYHMAIIHATMGHNKEALDNLQRAYLEHERWLVWLNAEEAFKPLREESSFRELLRSVGNH
jgi:TolB-like protein/Flp pilus assembly protein TadD